MKPSHEVVVFNQKFVLKSDAEPAYVQKVASFVNDKIESILSANKNASSLSVALLAALNISDDYFKLLTEQEKIKESDEAFRVETERKIESMIEKIDGLNLS